MRIFIPWGVSGSMKVMASKKELKTRLEGLMKKAINELFE